MIHGLVDKQQRGSSHVHLFIASRSFLFDNYSHYLFTYRTKLNNIQEILRKVYSFIALTEHQPY